jgi:hypothetical protein
MLPGSNPDDVIEPPAGMAVAAGLALRETWPAVPEIDLIPASWRAQRQARRNLAWRGVAW